MPCKYCQERIDRGAKYTEGWGDKNSRFLLIDKEPGGVSGRAGTLLNDILFEAGLSRDQFFITSIVRCSPHGNPGMKWVRDCRDKCMSTLFPQLPNLECIIALGSTAWKGMTDDGQVSMVKDRRRVILYRGIPTVCTYHPSDILRNPASRDWCVADMESYVQDKGFLRVPMEVNWELV